MSDLIELAEKYGCDKLHSHSYIPFYIELFAGRPIKRLLEIGIGYEDLMKPFVPHYVHGASLKMWEEYFPEAEIFACDIREETLVNEGRIRSMVANQADVADIAKLLIFANGSWDAVIDDGSHKTADQIFTARHLVPTMSPGSVYVIEDVQEPDVVFSALGPVVISRKNTAIDVWRFGKRPDDNLVVIQL